MSVVRANILRSSDSQQIFTCVALVLAANTLFSMEIDRNLVAGDKTERDAIRALLATNLIETAATRLAQPFDTNTLPRMIVLTAKDINDLLVLLKGIEVFTSNNITGEPLVCFHLKAASTNMLHFVVTAKQNDQAEVIIYSEGHFRFPPRESVFHCPGLSTFSLSLLSRGCRQHGCSGLHYVTAEEDLHDVTLQRIADKINVNEVLFRAINGYQDGAESLLMPGRVLHLPAGKVVGGRVTSRQTTN